MKCISNGDHFSFVYLSYSKFQNIKGECVELGKKYIIPRRIKGKIIIYSLHLWAGVLLSNGFCSLCLSTQVLYHLFQITEAMNYCIGFKFVFEYMVRVFCLQKTKTYFKWFQKEMCLSIAIMKPPKS